MLQVRISNFDGTNFVIMDKAINVSLSRSVSSTDEGCQFEYPKNDIKGDLLNPNIDGYTKRWEIWDTVTGKRLNYGAPNSITENGPNWKFAGDGRSKLLADFYKTKKTYYATISSIVDDLRYENIAIEPRTSTMIHDPSDTSEQTTVFGNVTIDEKYYGLSKSTKDNAIDDDNGLLRPGDIEPPNTYYTTDSFWAGMSKQDSLIVDLGDEYAISKIFLKLPWWGGIQRWADRGYSFTIDYATDIETPLTTLQGRDIGPMHNLLTQEAGSRVVGNHILFLGQDTVGTSVELGSYYVAQDQPGPTDMRYIRVNIQDVYAWAGNVFQAGASVNAWDYQCDPTFTGTFHGLSAVMKGKIISDTALGPANDCFASVVELGIYKEIFPPGDVKPLALQRIDNNNQQITYSHNADPTETQTTATGFRRFEPGGFFRRFTVDYSGANTTYKKFFPSDCSNCYPDGFKFGIVDQNNTLVYGTTNLAGIPTITAGNYTSNIMTKGAPNAVVTWVDAWPSVTDPLSWGTSYSYTSVLGDFAVIKFRGQSFRWYATVPSTQVGATVKIEIRQKEDANPFTAPTAIGGGHGTVIAHWSAWTTLEDTMTIPAGINSEVVYEIPFEYGILQPETTYEIRITNLDGNYCSIDSIEGYWSASFTQYNQDSNRVIQGRPEFVTQLYDQRFSGGSMVKWNNRNNECAFTFEGDRVVILSAKGRNHGKLKIGIIGPLQNIQQYDPATSILLPIPGGDTDGSITINLDTGKRGQEITQFIAFDSNDYFINDGMPWGTYQLLIYKEDDDTYTAYDSEIEADSFVYRCSNCKPKTGSQHDIQKYVYVDSIGAHERVGLSVSFEDQTHLDILTSIATAVQTEWDVDETGIVLSPRIGKDTNEILREGHNTIVSIENVSDVTGLATMLLSKGASIDGLPLSALVEDRITRAKMGRTVMRENDFSDIADYFQLVGMARGELKNRALPAQRITVVYTGSSLNLEHGDTFLLFTKKQGPLRVRIMRKQIDETDSNGRIFTLECLRFPLGNAAFPFTQRPTDPRL